MIRSMLLLALASAGSTAAAQTRPDPQWWGNLNLASRHFSSEQEFLRPGDRFNEFNPGIGVEVQWQPRHAVAVGFYRNSVDEISLYALYHYTPLQLGQYVRVGGMVGLITGYPGFNDGGIAPGGGFIAKVEGDRWGLNLIYLPEINNITPNTLGLQVKRRFGH